MATYAKDSYVGDGSTNQFAITFNYISSSHVKVYVDNVEDESFTFVTSTTVQTTSVPASGAIVTVVRETPKARLVDFQNASILNEATLDLDSNQMLYMVQETLDSVLANLGLNLADLWDAQSKRLTNLATPTDDSDAVNKGYADFQVSEAQAAAQAAQTAAQTALDSVVFVDENIDGGYFLWEIPEGDYDGGTF